MNKDINCHDCGSSVRIKDKDEEFEISDLKYCPICGSDNVDVE